MKLGIRAHDLGQSSAEDLALLAMQRGLQAIQLAPGKALVPPMLPGHFTQKEAQRIARIFACHDITIAVLGCYINPIHPDRQIRRQELLRFREALRFAKDFGCKIVATETGSHHADCSFHPDNRSDASFSELLTILQDLAGEAHYLGISIALEAASEHVLFDADRLHQALGLLPADSAKVIFDPINIMTANDLKNQPAFFERVLPMLGPRLGALHAKDALLRGEKLLRVAPGTGMLDYAALLAHLRQYAPDLPVLMEETDGPDRDPALAHLHRLIHQESFAGSH